MEEEIVKILQKRKEKIASMESCTGGLVASTITDVSGSSEVLEVSFITYSNDFKEKYGILKETIDCYSVYSIEVAREMAKQASILASSSWGIGTTGQIGRSDPKNPGKEINKIYVSIYQHSKNRYFDIIIEAQDNLSRKENKEKIVNEILKKFLQVVKED